MGTNGFEKRLTTLARRLGVCPQHGERLLCVIHNFTENRLPPEQDKELNDYLTRLAPRLEPWPQHDRCPRCGEGRICLACAEEPAAELDWSPLSDEERMRCLDLLAQTDFRLKGEP